MSRLRRAVRLVLGGRPPFRSLYKLLRSELRLPFNYPRFPKLNAPALTPYRNQFWFRAPLLLLVPGVLVVTVFAIRHAHSRHEAAALPPDSSLQTNWQAALDGTAPARESRRAVFPYSVVPGGVRDAAELSDAAAKDRVVAEHYSDFHMARAHTL